MTMSKRTTALACALLAISGCVGSSAGSGAAYAGAGNQPTWDGNATAGQDAAAAQDSGNAQNSGSDAESAGADDANAGTPDTGGTSTTTDAGSTTTPDTTGPQPPTDAKLKELGVIKLQQTADKVETAEGTTDDKGVVSFYSPHHNALIELNTVDAIDKDKLAAAPKMQARVRVEQSGAVFALVHDPAGKFAPLVYQGGMTNGKVEVDGATGMADGTLEIAFDDKAKSPFPEQKVGLVGVVVSMAIRFTLRTMIGMAIGAAVKSFVNKSCLFFNPLYTGWCGLISDIAKELSGVAVAGIKMKFSGNLSWGDLGTQAATSIANYFLQQGCEKATGAILLAVGPTSNNPWPLYDANVGLWKKIAHKATYMMNKETTNPPADPAKKKLIKPIVEATLRFLTAARPMVQKDVYITHSGKAPSKISDGKLYTFAMKQVENIADELKVVVTTVQLTTIISTTTTYTQLWNGVLISKQTMVIQQLKAKQTTQPWKPKGFNQALACALGVIDGFGGYLQGGATFPVPFETMQYINDALKVVDKLLDEAYAHIWGGAVPTPACYPDLYEPNNKASPAQATKNLGSKVTIGDVTSTKGDVDWYSLPLLGAWAKVQAGVSGRKPMGSNDCGTVPANAKLCVSMHWWSNIIELSGGQPVAIGGEVCGKVSDGTFVDPEFVVPWWNVSKVTGEQNQTLLVKVRQPAGQNLDIPYQVMMFAGGIF